jgi:Protein of unknown function (DUF3047)
MPRRPFLLLSTLLLAGCATPPPEQTAAFAEVTPFSSNWAGANLPLNWQSLVISRAKSPTRYETVIDPLTQRVVLRAHAKRACTGLKQRLNIDPLTRPLISWEWRVTHLIEGADNTDRDAEDSPVRLLLFFDGDRNRLPLRDQAALDLAQIASGLPPPYATLMYIWENRQPVGTIIDSSYTSQVKMIVVGSGANMLGGWKKFERNYVDDYRVAFGRVPGRLIGVGILTDSDNTGAVVEAFYGDIRLLSALP